MPEPLADAVDEFVRAAESLGLPVSVARARSGGDAADLMIDVGGRRVPVEIKRRASLTPTEAHALGRARAMDPDPVRVLVADRIPASTRTLLREHGWSWLDLRGHLHLAGPGLLVDADVQTSPEAAEHKPAVYGNASVEVACELMLDPDQVASVRKLARQLNRSPSTVSEALARLRDHGLLTGEGKPLVPELFWEIADHWKPPSFDLAKQPDAQPAIAEALRLGLDDPNSTGWAVTDTRAAAAYGAPVAVNSTYPPDFYVPDVRIARRALHLLGGAITPSARAARIRVAPTPSVCSHRYTKGTDEGFPLAHPLFVALDLAQDPVRGREVLEEWTPTGLRRVW